MTRTEGANIVRSFAGGTKTEYELQLLGFAKAPLKPLKYQGIADKQLQCLDPVRCRCRPGAAVIEAEDLRCNAWIR